jgi:hypothetical protein
VEYASKINKATGNFEKKMKAAFNYSSGIVRYSDAQNIKFNVDANKQDMVIFVIGVKK